MGDVANSLSKNSPGTSRKISLQHVWCRYVSLTCDRKKWDVWALCWEFYFASRHPVDSIHSFEITWPSLNISYCSGEPGLALITVEELHESASSQAGKFLLFENNGNRQQLSIETYEKAMRNSCQGSTRWVASLGSSWDSNAWVNLHSFIYSIL